MCLPSQKIALPKVFKTFEAITVETRIGTKDIIFLVIYRPPKQTSKRNDKQFKYYETVEQEINDIVMWASLKKQFVIVMGDLNMDRLKPNDREGKIFKDLEEVNNLQCMITEPTRIPMNSQTLLDVLLSNSPEVF
jgi:exonuclease III